MSLRRKLIYKRWKFKEGADFSSSHPTRRAITDQENPKMNMHHDIEGYYPKPKPEHRKPDLANFLMY